MFFRFFGTILIILGIALVPAGMYFAFFGKEVLFWVAASLFGIALVIGRASIFKGEKIMNVIDDLLKTLP